MGGDTISATGENALLDEIDELKDKLQDREKAESELKKLAQNLQEQVCFWRESPFLLFTLRYFTSRYFDSFIRSLSFISCK